ncbi:MAG TPA: hypothetical protein VM867_04870 [Xanthobacteraceae bacterium]|nr:hypothetical protein [Xanthobacteraceae bacterium]
MTTPRTFEVRRTPRGGIDFDFYRSNATALRGAAHHDATSLKFLGAGVFMSAAMLIVFLTIALARPVTVVEHIEAMRTVVVR